MADEELSVSSKREIGKTLGGFKRINTFLEDVIGAMKGVSLVKAVGAASPWLDAVGTSLAQAVPPVKFVVTLFEKLTAMPDPNDLGELAFTLSYEHAIAQSVESLGETALVTRASEGLVDRLRQINDSIPEPSLDFMRMSYDDLLLHPFITHADAMLDVALTALGYDNRQRREFVGEVHQRFVMHFKTLISHGDTREKFAPLRERIAAGTSDRSAAAALLEHAEYQRALFEERPVFGKEVFALGDVYIDTECGVLTWGEIRDESRTRPIDPFVEKNGGRRRLSGEVMRLIANPKFNDAIVVQGVAGSGKSAFTQWLSAELIRMGLRPIRVLLRDVRLERNRPVAEALAEAIRYDDESRRGAASYPRPDDVFNGGAIFRERIRVGDAVICPYVLILDGWDEISISVNEGFKVRLDRMLEQIRSEFLHNAQVPVRVILTGRPSSAVADSPFLRKTTPVLTLRPLNPDDLEQFIEKLAACIADPPVPSAPGSAWPQFDAKKFASIVDRYRTEFAALATRDDSAVSAKSMHSLEILGLPLLALLAVRLISIPDAEADEIIASPTTLYRNLVDLTCSGGKYIGSGEPVEQQFRLIGGRLRDLLRRTASAMTVCGKENISYTELRLRLKDAIDDLVKTVEKVTGDSVLSQLMISYFFKGGHEELGCEFLHKSFREYLFAEGIVETLKHYGRTVKEAPAERPLYWRDFERTDVRFDFSRALSSQLAAQWLSAEVVSYLGDLLQWETGRATGQKEIALPDAQPTALLELDQWKVVRDGMADVWDWWAEGVHMRPQPSIARRQELQFDPPYVQELVELMVPFDLPRGVIPTPPRTVAADAQLGDGLFRLSNWLHFFVAEAEGWLGPEGHRAPAELWENVSDIGEGPRRHQASAGSERRWVLFSPSGKSAVYWQNYAARINSAGWRPGFMFPFGCDCRGVDLRECHLTVSGDTSLIRTDWSFANLSRCSAAGTEFNNTVFRLCLLHGANLNGSSFTSSVELLGADLSDAYCDAAVWGCEFENVRCDSTEFTRCRFGPSVTFLNCNLRNASFNNADLVGVVFAHCDIEGAIFGGDLRAVRFENNDGAGSAEINTILISHATLLPPSFYDRGKVIKVPE